MILEIFNCGSKFLNPGIGRFWPEKHELMLEICFFMLEAHYIKIEVGGEVSGTPHAMISKKVDFGYTHKRSFEFVGEKNGTQTSRNFYHCEV